MNFVSLGIDLDSRSISFLPQKALILIPSFLFVVVLDLHLMMPVAHQQGAGLP
jgi:hypothetical protein